MTVTLSQPVIDQLLTDIEFRRGLVTALGVNENTIRHLANENRVNGNLTKYAALTYFKLKGYTEKEILVKSKLSKSA